jgi:hypothetical protein
MELYMPDCSFEPVVFKDSVKEDMIAFWKFAPSLYNDFQAVFKANTYITHITSDDCNAPIAFLAKSQKGVSSIVVDISIAESILRRGILGLN